MATPIQKNLAETALPALLWTQNMTMGNGEAADVLMRQISQARLHASTVNEASFRLGHYQAFRPKRSFTRTVSYRFSGRMRPMPIDLDD